MYHIVYLSIYLHIRYTYLPFFCVSNLSIIPGEVDTVVDQGENSIPLLWRRVLYIYLSIIPGGVDTVVDQGEDSIPPVVEEGIAVAVGEGNPKQQKLYL